MFGRQGGLGGGSGSGSSYLVEFRAGRMNMVGKMVHADTRKGLVYLNQADDGLMHFCWKDRTSGKVEDDLIVFPDDFEYKRVEQCKTGRVYVLKFKTSSRRMFFWMQEPKSDKDEDICRRVNDLMNNPPSASRSSGSEGGDLQYMLNNMSQQQLMQLFGGVGQMGGLSSLLGSMNRSADGNSSSRTASTPSSNRSTGASVAAGGTSPSVSTPENSSSSIPRTPTAPKAKGQKPKGNRVTLPDLQSYFSQLSPESGTAAATAATAAVAAGSPAPASNRVDIDFSSAIVPEDVNQLIADPARALALADHLPVTVEAPTSADKTDEIKDTVTSPHFQQAMSQFSSALQSGQLGPVVEQFQLTPEAVAAATTGDMEQFVKALEKPKIDEPKEEPEEKKE